MFQTAPNDNGSGSGKKGQTLDNSDPYSGFGKEYKATFNKMIGSTKIEKKPVVIQTKDGNAETKQVTRGTGILD